jgi:predicted metal-dependent hydrolase
VTAHTPTELPYRKVEFGYPEDLDPAWNRRRPEYAFAANGISLIMPFAEPYFVKSVRSALPQLEGDLRVQTEGYLRQEIAHHVQHRRFNDLLVAQMPAVGRVERWMRRTYGWLSRRRSQKFNLAFAASSETIAFSIARWIEKNLDALFDDADPVPTSLFLWHLAEEVEHKAAAYDVFEELDGSRLRYAWTAVVSLTILAWLVWAATVAQLVSSRRWANPLVYWRLLIKAVSLSFELLPTLAVSALPGHHPDSLVDPTYLPTWLATFDPATGRLSPPTSR